MAEYLLNKTEVADRCSVSHRTITRLIENGQIKALKIGSQVRIREADLAAYVARQAKAGAR